LPRPDVADNEYDSPTMTARLTTALEHRRRIRRAVEHIERELLSHPHAWPDLNELSEVACISPHHFIRLYRHAVGETPQNTVRRFKLSAARHRLAQQPDLGVTDLAIVHGYDSPASFTRAYRLEFGAPPSRQPVVRSSESTVACWLTHLPPIVMRTMALSSAPGAVGATFDELMGHLDVAHVPRFAQDMYCELWPDGRFRRACAVENPWVIDSLKLTRQSYGDGPHLCISGQPDAARRRLRDLLAEGPGHDDRPILMRYLNDPAYRTRAEQRIELYVPLITAPQWLIAAPTRA
jgi:AraC-like DNA-binding protein